jgi:carbon monoxide dehydrogenase subunit G
VGAPPWAAPATGLGDNPMNHDRSHSMTVLHEEIVTPLAIDDAFAFVADFANSMHWDPGVATSERLGPGPVRVGARYRLGIRRGSRIVPMEYRVTVLEPPHRVVLVGDGGGVAAVDEIRFTPTDSGGTKIDYAADIRLRGLLRLAQPFAGGAFAKIARDARDGMRRTLDARAAVGRGNPGEELRG